VNAFAKALLVYSAEPCARTFDADLHAHLLHGGFVLCRPDVFLMARPVARTAERAAIVNPFVVFPRAQCDCWHVYLVAGSVGEALRFMPHPLEWVSWERENVLRFYRLESIRRRIPVP
jgi:hypothetical protein